MMKLPIFISFQAAKIGMLHLWYQSSSSLG